MALLSDATEVPLNVVGGSNFGRSPKINASRTFNLIISDDFLTDSYGYKLIEELSSNAGRSIFSSIRGNFLLAVSGSRVFKLLPIEIPNNPLTQFSKIQVGMVNTFRGSVFIAENNASQIAICDQSRLYIYNYSDNTFVEPTLPTGVIPGYVEFHDGSFLITDKLSSSWYLSAPNDGNSWNWGPSGTPVQKSIQTKPDLAQAVIRVPGGGNMIFAVGKTVTEPWIRVPTTAFYQRSTSSNIDYGVINPETISSLDTITAWLGTNGKSDLAIMYSSGGPPQQISTDGYNYRFSQLNYPEKSFAFFIKLSGHLLYQVTFYDSSDNLTVIYDFTTKQFFDATDENGNFHILRDVAYFEGRYYGLSFNDGNLYQLREDIYAYDYGERGVFEKPRYRVCPNIRGNGGGPFVAQMIEFLVEQGNDPRNIIPSPKYQPRLVASVSKDDGYNYSSYHPIELNRLAQRMNSVRWEKIGYMNSLVFKIQFFGTGPVNAAGGRLLLKEIKSPALVGG